MDWVQQFEKTGPFLSNVEKNKMNVTKLTQICRRRYRPLCSHWWGHIDSSHGNSLEDKLATWVQPEGFNICGMGPKIFHFNSSEFRAYASIVVEK